MPGSMYQKSLRLTRAFTEGFEAGVGASNPHPAGSPENTAWEAGYNQDCAGEADFYGGVAAHTGDWWCTEGPGAP